MKNLSLFFIAMAVCTFGFSDSAEAKKRSRYIKRMHGAKINWNIVPYVKEGGEGAATDAMGTGAIDLAYSYNWKGMIEVGPYLGVAWTHLPKFNLMGLPVGIFAEYNFIKNKGKKKMVPSAGLKIGASFSKAAEQDMAIKVDIAPYVSLKYFVAKRTPLIATVGYKYSTPTSAFFKKHIHGSFFMGGFAYYFDFY